MNRELAKLITGQIFLHACMTGMRLATPLLALQQGYSTLAVGVLLALFSVTQVFMAIPAGRFTDRHGLKPPVKISVVMACVGAGLAPMMRRLLLVNWLLASCWDVHTFVVPVLGHERGHLLRLFGRGFGCGSAHGDEHTAPNYP